MYVCHLGIMIVSKIDIYTSVIIKITNRITAKTAEKEKEIIEIIFVILGLLWVAFIIEYTATVINRPNNMGYKKDFINAPLYFKI